MASWIEPPVRYPEPSLRPYGESEHSWYRICAWVALAVFIVGAFIVLVAR